MIVEEFRKLIEFRYSMADDPVGVSVRVPVPILKEDCDELEEWFALVIRSLRRRLPAKREPV